MNWASALLALVSITYTQSGLPGINVLIILFRKLKLNLVTRLQGSNRTTTEISVESTKSRGIASTRQEAPPVTVSNRNVDEANTNIEVNYHVYNESTSRSLSDGGSNE